MPRSTSSQPSQRQLRVGEQARHALSEVFQRGEVRDEALAGSTITVLEVRMSPDLKAATAYVSPLGSADKEAVVAALNRNVRFIRGRVSPALRQMRSIPEFRFRLDTRFENAARIDALLDSPHVAQDLDEDGKDRE